MSGPVVPPLEVTEVDGSPDGRPITKIIVSNGDLSISGRTATIDTSGGGGGTPATPANAIQFNSDPAGTFTGSAQLLYQTGANNGRIEMKTGAALTMAEIKSIDGWGLHLQSSDTDNTTRGEIAIFGEGDAADGIYLLPAAGTYVYTGAGGFSTSGVGVDLLLTANLGATTKAQITLTEGDDGDIDIQVEGTGATNVKNYTTDQDSTLNVVGNGAGTPIINLKNDAKEVRLTCETDDQLYVRGPTSGERFTFDATGPTGGITFPDGTTQSSLSLHMPGADLDATGTDYDRYTVTGYPPFGTSRVQSMQINDEERVYLMPFVSPKSGTISEVGLYIGTLDLNDINMLMGIYSTTTTGGPSTLLGYASFDVGSGGATGVNYATSFTASAPVLQSGVGYWIGYCYDATPNAGPTVNTGSYFYNSIMSPGDDIITTGYSLQSIESISSSLNALPATVDLDDYRPVTSGSNGRVHFSIKW